MNVESETLMQLISAVLAILAAVFGAKWQKFKNLLMEANVKAKQLEELSKSLTRALDTLVKAEEDDKITNEEYHAVVQAFKDVLYDAKKLLGG